MLYLEQERITVWKQRGGYLKRRWGGSTVGRIVRSDTSPTKILGPRPEAEAEADRRTTILNAVGKAPGAYSKTSLIEDELGISGRDRPAWRRTIEALINEGKIHTEGRYSKLYPAGAEPAAREVVAGIVERAEAEGRLNPGVAEQPAQSAQTPPQETGRTTVSTDF